MVSVKTPPKDIRLATTTGHVINLPASSTVEIPDSVLEDAMARGCAVADEDYEIVEKSQPVYGKEALDRKALNQVEAIIKQMMEDKKPNEWTKEDRPSAKAVGRIRKARTTKEMVDKVWNERFASSG